MSGDEGHYLYRMMRDPADDEAQNIIDLGHDIKVMFFSSARNERAGLFESHRTPDGRECGGSVLFDVPGEREAAPNRPYWTVEQWEPLTLSPSIRCGCGNHGFIRDGRWVPA